MAEFTAQMGEPFRWLPTPGGPTTSSGEIAGGAFKGLAQILGGVLQASQENRLERLSGNLSNSLQGLATSYANQPKLVGEEEAKSPQEAAASADPTVQAHAADVSKLAQAHAQGRMSRADMLTRASNITQEAINANPRFTKELQETAQRTLGFEPTAELSKYTFSVEDQNRRIEENIKQHDAEEASNRGFTVPKADGSGIDIDKTAAIGREMAHADYLMKNIAQQSEQDLRDQQLLGLHHTQEYEDQIRPLQLAEANFNIEQEPAKREALQLEIRERKAAIAKLENAPLTETQLQNQQYINLSDKIKQPADAIMHSVYANLLGTFNNPDFKNMPEEKARALLETNVGRQEASFGAYFEQYLNQPGILPQVKKDLREDFKAYFAHAHDLVKGDLSSAEAQTRMVQSIQARMKSDFMTTTSGVGRLFGALGEPAANAALAFTMTADSDIASQANKSIRDFALGGTLTSKPTLPQTAHNTADVATRKTDLSQYPESHQRPIIRQLQQALDSYAARRTDLTPKELGVYSNTISNFMDAVAQSHDPVELANATRETNTPQMLDLFDRYAKANPTQAAALGKKILDTNREALFQGARDIANGMPGVRFGRIANSFAEAKAADIKAQENYPNQKFGAKYNTATGQVELSVSGGIVKVDEEGNLVELAAPGLRAPKELIRRIADMNMQLNAISQMRQYGTDEEKTFNERQIKQFTIKSSGMEIKGAHISMPGEEKTKLKVAK